MKRLILATLILFSTNSLADMLLIDRRGDVVGDVIGITSDPDRPSDQSVDIYLDDYQGIGTLRRTFRVVKGKNAVNGRWLGALYFTERGCVGDAYVGNDHEQLAAPDRIHPRLFEQVYVVENEVFISTDLPHEEVVVRSKRTDYTGCHRLPDNTKKRKDVLKPVDYVGPWPFREPYRVEWR